MLRCSGIGSEEIWLTLAILKIMRSATIVATSNKKILWPSAGAKGKPIFIGSMRSMVVLKILSGFRSVRK
jgi:hypothetical protein